MGSPKDPPESTNILPRPELNPLLNPRLADNMGRWAEVYFTSPPEKREEAVLGLLHELEAENPNEISAGDPAVRAAYPETERPAETLLTKPSKEARVNLVQCPSCGHNNPATHQFCGMCGASMEHPAATRPNVQESEPESRAADDRSDVPTTGHKQPGQHDELSLFRSFSEHRSADDYDLDPPRPYRLYIGGGLAVLILLLGYMAWSVGRTAQSSRGASAPPPSAGEKAPAPESQQAPAGPSNAEQQPHAQAGDSRDATKATEAQTKPTPPPHEPSPASPTASAVEDNSPQSSATAGGQELATAQRYLAGSNGQARDSAEAAKWLWKSMAKQNGEAALLLADLYLKGDGVSQNCDQARILLDTAARKGVSGAGDRLRNLQAFGCQ